ncbi:MAG: hypothetical protein ACE5JI_18905 [Acidobacteriota bacterium]
MLRHTGWNASLASELLGITCPGLEKRSATSGVGAPDSRER